MSLRFFNALTSRLEPFAPAVPPHIDFLWKGDRAREGELGAQRAAALVGTLMDALVHLGYSVNQAIEGGAEPLELYFGAEPPPEGTRVWLRPGAPLVSFEGPEVTRGELERRGFGAPELRLLTLGARYREPLRFTWEALEAAREELSRVRTLARGLEASHGSSAPSLAGLAGYKKRLRDALADDLDFPKAWASVRAGLRPGALSPGSQLGVLREAELVLGLDLFRVPG